MFEVEWWSYFPTYLFSLRSPERVWKFLAKRQAPGVVLIEYIFLTLFYYILDFKKVLELVCFMPSELVVGIGSYR